MTPDAAGRGCGKARTLVAGIALALVLSVAVWTVLMVHSGVISADGSYLEIIRIPGADSSIPLHVSTSTPSRQPVAVNATNAPAAAKSPALAPDLRYDGDDYKIWDCSGRNRKVGTLPTFLVIGVHKGGSTALYAYLTKHAHVKSATCKEVNFFANALRFRRGPDFYRTHFQNLSVFEDDRVITGEATPNYVRDPQAAPRIHALMPNVRAIVSLREPVARFQSHWIGAKEHFNGELGNLSCGEAWQAHATKYNTCLATNPVQKCVDKEHQNGVVRGLYAYQIERWLKYFDKDQLLVLQAEAMFKDKVATMQQIAAFLGLRPFLPTEIASFEDVWIGTEHLTNPLLDSCRPLEQQMNDFYAPHNSYLYQLLKSTFPRTWSNWILDAW